MKRILAALFLAVALATGAGAALAGEVKTLTVSAAVSLSGVLTEIGGEFQKENPGVLVHFNFGASGTLLRQLEAGGQADLFAAADQETMAMAEEKGLTDQSTKRSFAANRLVLAVPARSGARISSAADLAGEAVKRVAVGDPAFVPVGRYAKRYLEGAGLWSTIGPKLVTGGNARQVLDYVGRGEVEAGFVFATDAAARKDSVRVADALLGAEKVLYPMAVLEVSGKRELAMRFMEYATGPKGREAAKKHGFAEP